MNKIFDLLIIGGGALGTFHAYHALQQGLSVCILEKNSEPQGATVRNFGQVVPSGMNLKWQTFGRESLNIYKSIQEQFDISIRQNGSVYLASNQEELQLIEELHAINNANDYNSELLTKEQCLNNYQNLREDYCVGGLFFPEEVTVEPRTMIHRLREYLITEFDLHYYPNELAINCSEGDTVEVTTAQNNQYFGKKVLICSGTEFKTLYPELFNQSDLVAVKIQMLSTKPQPKNYQLNGSILTGLSIRRYEAFSECPSYNEISAKEDPNALYKQYGVHILFKQANDGSVILGDTHEYADAKDIDHLRFDRNEAMDKYMITEAKKIIDLPTYEIQHRWLGFYSQCKNSDIFTHNVSNNIHIVTGIGGKGMTASAGFSKQHLQNIL